LLLEPLLQQAKPTIGRNRRTSCERAGSEPKLSRNEWTCERGLSN